MSPAHDLHQVLIAFIIFRQQHQVIISVLATGYFPVKPGIRRHINLAAQDRIDPLLPAGAVKINDTVHHAVVRDSRRIHPQLFHPFYIFFYLIGTVQQAVLRVDMQMGKCHDFFLRI